LIFIQEKVDKEQVIRLNFICTQFKESHLSQVGTNGGNTLPCEKVFCYSGGTEATALFPMAAKTLEQAGFECAPFLKVNPFTA
jgi:arsenate reductase